MKDKTEKEAVEEIPFAEGLEKLGVLGLVSLLTACDEEAEIPETPSVRSSGVYQPMNQENTVAQNSEAVNVDNSVYYADQAYLDRLPKGSQTNSGNMMRDTPSINGVSANANIGTLAGPQPRFASLTPVAGRVALNATMMGVSQAMSDGRLIPAWSFLSTGSSGFNNDRVTPAPCIEVVQGQTVQLELTSMLPHTIHLHGLDVDQANDGVPSTSGFVATPMPPMPMMPPIVGPPGAALLPSPFSYVFTAPHAGTYMYHCHVDTVLHMEMGMSGTIIVRPPDGNLNQLWSGGPTFDREFVWHLHTIDSSWHTVTQSGVGTARYRPDYFMINGRDGANLFSDPVTALHGMVGETILVRAVNVGYLPANINLANLPFQVVSSDGRPLAQSIEVTDFVIAPGERYDILFTMPVATNNVVRVEYFNIMGSSILGTAQTSISSF